MSSSEDEYPDYIEGGPQIISHLGGGGVDDSKAKKRRVQRACDVCRRKKIKCDGAQKSNGQCSNCISYQYDCTYVEAAKKRGPPKGYVESLENRLEKMEKLLKRMCPDQDFTQELGAPIDRDSWQHDKPTDKLNSPSTFRAPQTTRRPVRAATGIQTGPDTDLDTSDEEGHSIPQAHLSITDRLKELGLSNGDTRFYGKSSGVNLIQTAHQRKSEHVANKNRESDGASPQQQSNFSHRSQFWGPSPWEIKMAQSEETATFDLPPMELIESLVDLFFKYVIPYFPLLHRPTFERHYRDHLQDRDASFASVLLLVCALGSRWSDDSRVLLEPNAPLHSAGWKYFQQVHIFRKSLLAPPSLFDVQMYALAGLFLQSTAFPQAGWTLVGVGLRLVQDVGAHRRKVYAPNISVEDELWKRAVWTLISIDRISSCVLGRPCSLQDEDFDLELPIEVDDEYWTNSDPALAFKQPEGKPSIVSSFIAFLNLMQILAFALRTVYSINKSKILLGFVGQQWEQHIVSELDTALNKWLANVPRHLQWEKNMENETFFAQSAHLYACYYHLQILVHRPFIPSPKRPANHPFPSLNICANAARSCAAIVDYHRRRSKHVAPWTLIAAFNSGIVILLNIWGANKGFVSTDIRLQLEDVHKCMDALSSVEERWHAAGRLVDILRDLSNMGDLPVPPRSPIHAGQKRERDSDSPPSFSPATAQQVPTGSRPMAGRLSKSRPGSRQVSQPQVHIAGPGQHGSFAPVASHQPVELRRVPHNEFSYPSPATAASRDSANWYASPTTPTGLQHHDPSILYGAHHPPMQNPVYHQGPPTAPFPNAYDAPRGAHQPSEGISLITNMPPQAPYSGEHQLSSQPRGPVTLSVGNTDQYVGNEATMAMWSQAPPGFEWDTWGTFASGPNPMSPSNGDPHSQPSAGH